MLLRNSPDIIFANFLRVVSKVYLNKYSRLVSRLSKPGIGLMVLIMLSSPGIKAQDIQFTGSVPSVVVIGEQFRLTYSINRRGSNLKLPDIGNFRLISGPSTSSSSSVQVINGNVTQTESVTFTYVLMATEVGEYTFEPATITLESGQYSSNPVRIEVVADSDGRSSLPGQESHAAAASPARVSGEDLFVNIIIDKKEVYQGEAITATIKLYSKLDISGIENVRFPTFSGFFQQDIETPPLRNLDREVIDGEIYGTGVLKKLILFPQRSGEIDIEPFEMDALVRERAGRRGGMFDNFFGGFETRRVPVRSPAISIKVNPLPGPVPSGFKGAVGEFSLNAVLDQEETKANDAISLNISISGNGNLKLIGQPTVDFPPGLEVYDPDIKEDINNSAVGQEGSISFNYLMIPRSEGNYMIPPVQFSYFSPRHNAFRTLSTEEFNLLVHKSDEADNDHVAAGLPRRDLRVIGSDIRFIKTGVVLKRIDNDPFKSFGFYLWFIIPLMMFAVIIVIHRKAIKDRSNIALMRNKRASRMARRRLKVAGRYLKDNNHVQFFEEMLKAQWGYLSDKLLIPVSDLNRKNARAALLEKNVPEKEADSLMDIIEECEFFRYSPSSSSKDMDGLYTGAIKIIISIEQNIR